MDKIPSSLRTVRILSFVMCSADNVASTHVACLLECLYTNLASVVFQLGVHTPCLQDSISNIRCKYRLALEDKSCFVDHQFGYAQVWLHRVEADNQSHIARQLFCETKVTQRVEFPTVMLFVYPEFRDQGEVSHYNKNDYPMESFVKYIRAEVNSKDEWVQSIVVEVVDRSEPRSDDDSIAFDLKRWCIRSGLPYFVVDITDKTTLRNTLNLLQEFALKVAYGSYKMSIRGTSKAEMKCEDCLVGLSLRVVVDNPALYPLDQLSNVLPPEFYEIVSKRAAIKSQKGTK
eukprot:TRINITY_DN4584_c0_g1_i1.p1 TRINITY_DN4584_c0_g1~~TRINITY_DN4584_c0_g1_i1.p1  ORF type:complete len:288 (+),score=42.48 TRINITY_DN4584_c0_g1_i1:196-1059(+)